MTSSVKIAALVSAMFLSGAVMAQSNNTDLVTKPAPSSESKPPSMPGDATSGKTRAEVKSENKMGAKKGTTPDGKNEPDGAYQKNTVNANAPAKTRAEVKNEVKSGGKMGTTPDGKNEPDGAYQKPTK